MHFPVSLSLSRFYSNYELPLLVQSVIMTVTMFLMIHLCVKVRRSNALMKIKDRVFSGKHTKLILSTKSHCVYRLVSHIHRLRRPWSSICFPCPYASLDYKAHIYWLLIHGTYECTYKVAYYWRSPSVVVVVALRSANSIFVAAYSRVPLAPLLHFVFWSPSIARLFLYALINITIRLCIAVLWLGHRDQGRDFQVLNQVSNDND